MSFKLPDLPYTKDAFGKTISVETFDYHYGKHHATYVNNLNNFVKGTEWENKSLEDIVVKYRVIDVVARTPRSSIMLPSIGTIPFIGIASHPTRLSPLLLSRRRSWRNGGALPTSLLSSRHRRLPTSDLAGPGSPRAKENS